MDGVEATTQGTHSNQHLSYFVVTVRAGIVKRDQSTEQRRRMMMIDGGGVRMVVMVVW